MPMTPEQIKQTMAIDLSTTGWLKEIALQLALLNQKSPGRPPSK